MELATNILLDRADHSVRPFWLDAIAHAGCAIRDCRRFDVDGSGIVLKVAEHHEVIQAADGDVQKARQGIISTKSTRFAKKDKLLHYSRRQRRGRAAGASEVQDRRRCFRRRVAASIAPGIYPCGHDEHLIHMRRRPVALKRFLRSAWAAYLGFHTDAAPTTPQRRCRTVRAAEPTDIDRYGLIPEFCRACRRRGDERSG